MSTLTGWTTAGTLRMVEAQLHTPGTATRTPGTRAMGAAGTPITSVSSDDFSG